MNIDDLKGCFANVNDDNLLRENGLLYAENKELKEEIERLNKELQDTKEHLGEYLYEQEEENKRLNNIINELENYIDKRLSKLNIVKEREICMVIRTIKYKLQELKGDGSND